MQRRDFIKSVTTAAVLSAVPKIYSAVEPKNKIKPPRLKAGDTLGLITPGSYISENELKDSIENLEKLGYKVIYQDTDSNFVVSNAKSLEEANVIGKKIEKDFTELQPGLFYQFFFGWDF